MTHITTRHASCKFGISTIWYPNQPFHSAQVTDPARIKANTISDIHDSDEEVKDLARENYKERSAKMSLSQKGQKLKNLFHRNSKPTPEKLSYGIQNMIKVLEMLKEKACEHTLTLLDLVRTKSSLDTHAVLGVFLVFFVTSIPPGEQLPREKVSEPSDSDLAKLRKHVKEMTLYAIGFQHGTSARQQESSAIWACKVYLVPGPQPMLTLNREKW
jgi:hypothetical protein